MAPLAYVAGLHLLGSLVAICALRGRALGFATASGLVWGLGVHALFALVALLARYATGAAPLYRPGTTALACGVAIALLVPAVVLRAPDWGVARARIAAAQLVALVALCVVTLGALHWNASIFSVDSFEHIERGLALARVTELRFLDLDLGTWPVFPMLLHASTDLARVEYLHFLPPVLSASFFATLAVVCVASIRLLGRSRRIAWIATALGLAWLASCYFVAFFAVYVHVNWIASMYVLLLLTCAWRALVTGERGFWTLAALAALCFSLCRVEGPLFLSVFLGLLALEAREDPQGDAVPIVALALPSAIWCVLVAWIVGGDARFAGAGRLGLMATALVLVIALGHGMRDARVARHERALALAAPVLLAVCFVVMVLLRPAHMLEHAFVWLRNATAYGNWATGWILPASLALALPVLGPVPRQRFVLLGVLCFVLLSLDLTWFGTWRIGWYDSGNRMLMHVLPVTTWILVLKGAAITPSTEGAHPGGGSTRPPRLRTLRKRRRKGWRHRLRRRLRWRSVPGVEWLGTRALPWLYVVYLGLVWRTSRVSTRGLEAAFEAYEESGGIVALLWHEDTALSYYAWSQLGVRPHILVNESFAGDISAAIARRCGYATFRGGASSGRSRNRPEALRAMIAHMRREPGVVYGIAVDGSQGPPYRLKRGALVLARKCDVPIALVRIASTPCLHLPTWDRTAVPLPFGRILVAVDAPHRVPEDARSRPALLAVASQLEAQLLALAARTLRDLGRPLPDALRARLAEPAEAPRV